MSRDSGSDPPDRDDTTVRIVKSAALREGSQDPIELYEHHFVHLIERMLELNNQPILALDLAAGVGYPTLTLWRILPENSRIIALGNDRADLTVFHEQITGEQHHKIFPRKERLDRLPFAAGIFDVVWASLATSEINPLRPALRQALRVLRPGGQLLIATPLRETFIELAAAIGKALGSLAQTETLQELISKPPDLLDAEAWEKMLRRCGATDILTKRNSLEITIEPPLSMQRLFTQHLLPLWLGGDSDLQAKTLRLLDDEITQPFTMTAHVACAVARPGYDNLMADSITGQ